MRIILENNNAATNLWIVKEHRWLEVEHRKQLAE